MIRFESCGSKLDEIASDNLFCYIRLSKAISRRPVMVQTGLREV